MVCCKQITYFVAVLGNRREVKALVKNDVQQNALPVALPQSHQHLFEGTDILEERNKMTQQVNPLYVIAINGSEKMKNKI